jgi:transposase
MSEALSALPRDIESLRELVLAQRIRLDEKDKLLDESKNIISSMHNELIWEREKYLALRARYFGSSSEKSIVVPGQGILEFNEAEACAVSEPMPVTVIEIAAHERKKRGRKQRSAEIETIEIVHDLPQAEKQCPCCGAERPAMGEERSVEYDLIPAHVVRKVHLRKKYGSCRCEAFIESTASAVVIAPAVAKIVPKSEFTNRTIAFFLVGKYEDAIPFYRMVKVLARSGLEVSRATLCNLAIGVGKAIGDLIEAMWQDVRGSPVILMDETTVQVLHEPGRSPEAQSYMWLTVGYRDKRPIILFHYHPTRRKVVPETTLAGFSGYLQTDGYDGYASTASRTGIVHVGCFAHIRRAFHDAQKVSGPGGLADEMLALIAKVYSVERRLRERYDKGEFDTDTFLRKRETDLELVFTDIRLWLGRNSLSVAPSTKLGEAISYAQGQIEKSVKFVKHELLTPDTNRAENAIRPFVVGRKNWMFNNTPRGAHASAGLYSLIETAKATGHDPFKYLSYLFDTLPRARTTEERIMLLPYHLDPKSY